MWPLFLISTVLSCGENENKNSKSRNIQIKSKESSSIVPEISKEESLKLMNNNLLQFLKTKNYEKFATYIHPEKGVTFSMYAFVNSASDRCFTKKEFLYFISSPADFTWGEKNASGELYRETLQNYLSNWVWKKDFSTASYELNGTMSRGNSQDNSKQIYPECDITVNFLSGTKEFSEMDWQTLGFVFEEFYGKYYLIAVINDQWTV